MQNCCATGDFKSSPSSCSSLWETPASSSRRSPHSFRNNKALSVAFKNEDGGVAGGLRHLVHNVIASGSGTMITEYSSNNCSDNISLSPPYDTVDVIAEATRNNATIICDEFHLLISDDQRIFVQVKSTNAIAFTFIACALLLFFYSCCWFNRFYLCENRAASSARSFSNAAVRSAAMAAVAVISDRSLRCTGGCSRNNYPTTPREECCAIDIG